jgi:hypothetical protein
MKRLAFLRSMHTVNPQDQGTDPERPAPVPNAVQPPSAIIPTGTAPGEFILSIAEGPRRTKRSGAPNAVIPTGTERSGVEWRNLHPRQQPNR